MSYLTFSGKAATTVADYNYGITDLVIMENLGQPSVYSVTGGSNYAMASYKIAADGTLTYATWVSTPSVGLAGAGPYILPVTTGTAPTFWLTGVGDATTWTYEIRADGFFTSRGALTGIAAGSSNQPLIARAGDTVVFGSPRDAEVTFYTVSGTGVSNPRDVVDGSTSFLKNPAVLTAASVGGTNFFVVGSAIERGITVIADETAGPRVTASFSALDDVALMQPTAMATATIGDKTFVIVGSAPQTGTSGALTVFELTSDGQLIVVDHLLDTRNTRFGQVQSLDTIDVNGRIYVAAAGGDNGMTLIGLAQNGALLHLQSIEDTVENGLSGVTATQFFASTGALNLYVASEADPGVSHFTVQEALQGVTGYGTEAADTLSGGAQADWLFGGSGDDLITAGDGADLISDGDGADTLSGGAGADVFYIAYDGAADVITDFNPAEDMIDLSDWRYVNDPSELTITASGTGFVLSYRDEVLTVNPAAGVTLDEAAVRAAIVVEGGRLWEPLPDQCRWQNLDNTPVNFTAFGSGTVFDSLMIFGTLDTAGFELMPDEFVFLPAAPTPEVPAQSDLAAGPEEVTFVSALIPPDFDTASTSVLLDMLQPDEFVGKYDGLL